MVREIRGEFRVSSIIELVIEDGNKVWEGSKSSDSVVRVIMVVENVIQLVCFGMRSRVIDGMRSFSI